MSKVGRIIAIAALVAPMTAVAQDGANVGASPASGCALPGHEEFRSAMPPVQQLGAVSFVTGGIGVDEARAMREARAKYPLTLTFVEHYGEKDQFLSHILVEIRRDDGTPVLCATSDGPYLYVDIEPGRYQVSATSDGGRQIDREATIAAGDHRDITFVWPASGAAR